jgi:hypothetical protein
MAADYFAHGEGWSTTSVADAYQLAFDALAIETTVEALLAARQRLRENSAAAPVPRTLALTAIGHAIERKREQEAT